MTKKNDSAPTEKVATACCPSCNTLFPVDKAPWLKRMEHCPIHDRVFLPDVGCEFCTDKQKQQVKDTRHKAQADAANAPI